MTIGERIKFYRKQNKITQKQLGEMCDLAEITIRQYEADKYIPKIGNLQKISLALQIPLTLLMDLREDSSWTRLATDFPDSPVITKGNDLYLKVMGSEESAYIDQITYLLHQLNIKGLQNANEYLQELIINSDYLKNSSATE